MVFRLILSRRLMLDGRPIHVLQGVFQLVASIAAVGEQMNERGEVLHGVGDDTRRAIAILNVGGVRDRAQHIALRIGEDRQSQDLPAKGLVEILKAKIIALKTVLMTYIKTE